MPPPSETRHPARVPPRPLPAATYGTPHMHPSHAVPYAARAMHIRRHRHRHARILLSHITAARLPAPPDPQVRCPVPPVHVCVCCITPGYETWPV